jgi:outer membrane protein TolC
LVTKSDLDASRNALAGFSENIARAEENYLTAKSRFAGGAGSNLEVLEAQRLLTEAKLNRSGAQFQVRVDRATLLRLAGSR